MDNSKYEAVLKAVQAACPELMELSFGCLFKVRSSFETSHRQVKICRGTKGDIVYGGGIGATTSNTWHKDHIEILGHPVRLSHVLRAILAKNFDAHPLSAKSNPRYWQQKILDVWDLAKDDLSLQSPETIDFLFKILCG